MSGWHLVRPVPLLVVGMVWAPAVASTAVLGRTAPALALIGCGLLAAPTVVAVRRCRPDAALPAPPEVPHSSTPELCRAWNRSDRYLRESRPTARRAAGRLVALRSAYLDELQRRDPEGFTLWLRGWEHGPLPPDRFIRAARPPGASLLD